ncbi:unnamed protein product [Phytophthora lilii]|uniref:Unnamed protein product n=1 Tax=Phytophthora lilii TaxID=2077276 RepID=A0A9W6TIL7_9STRA|nr:unnamed protein product [Phytophthora lilii]
MQKVAGKDASIFVFECELVNPKQVEQAVQEANAFHERPTDHVVYAASRRIKPGYFWEQDVAVMKEAMDVNYLGAVVLVKVCLLIAHLAVFYPGTSSYNLLNTSTGYKAASGSNEAAEEAGYRTDCFMKIRCRHVKLISFWLFDP